jgi:glycosyltransferase involved in cell wall biosynthesis
MSGPGVSVVTPSLNQSEFIADAIESVLAQQIPELEHIVVDGGSTDRTLDVLARYPHVKLLRDSGRGQSRAVNIGLREAEGEVIGWLNADDRYVPGAIASALAAFDREPTAGVVYGNAQLIDERGAVLGEIRSGPFDLRRQLNGINGIPQPAAFIRAWVFDRVGFLDERLDYVMDYELWLRAARVTRLVWVDETWAQFRSHLGSKSVGRWEAFWPEARAVARSYGGPFFSEAWRLHTLNTAFVKMSLRRLAGRSRR